MCCVPISEIFSSIQGEGKYAGVRQLFIRFASCNLACDYCDTPATVAAPYCDLENAERLVNPVGMKDIFPYIEERLQKPHHSISLTGGEPLLYADFIHQLAQEVRLPLFLETNGTLVKQLKRVIDDISIISMDFKMPDAVHEVLWDKHKQFLEIARQKDVYVKIVIAEETSLADFTAALDLLRSIDENIMLVLQPLTPYGGFTAPQSQKMLQWQSIALKKIKDVRVIAQMHVMMGQR